MKKIDELIKDINEISQIPFILKDELGDIYMSPSFNAKRTFIEEKISILNKEFSIIIDKSEEKILPLLSYFIVNVIKENNYKKNMIINDLLSGKEIHKEDIIDTYSFLLEQFDLVTVYVEGDIEEAFSLIKEGYEEEDIVVLVYQDRVLLLGKLEAVQEHALSIKETLASNISGRVIISYCKVNSYNKVGMCLKKCNKKILVADRFNIEIDIIGEQDIIFEEIVESIDPDKKKDLVHEFNKGLSKIDNDMMKTIDIFFKCGLNLSEASKELYIHRNTLIYRIEKIQKYTGFDIKNFNEAVIFKIIYTLWKEENKIIFKKSK